MVTLPFVSAVPPMDAPLPELSSELQGVLLHKALDFIFSRKQGATLEETLTAVMERMTFGSPAVQLAARSYLQAALLPYCLPTA